MRFELTSETVTISGGAVLEDGDGIEQVQRYDPRNDQWTDLASMLIPRSGAAICTLGNFIYVVGEFLNSLMQTKLQCC